MSLDLFDLVRSSRNAHGLRHGDYLRYRQYCSRRLLRLRRSLKLTHGKGRYKPQPLELRMVRDPKHLMLPLFCCERAWAYAMQVKRENTAQEPRPRFHLLQRLNKAAKWSVVLSKLCAERGDKRTALEAEAYHLRALTCHAIGDARGRDLAAKAYRRCRRASMTSNRESARGVGFAAAPSVPTIRAEG